VAVCRPLLAATVCRRRRAAAVMVALVVTFLAINLHFVWTTGLRSVQVRTDDDDDDDDDVNNDEKI